MDTLWESFIVWMGDDMNEFSIKVILEAFYYYCNPGDMKRQIAASDVLFEHRR